jgi:zinc D-Ala-D-Ala carboxypeptidase
MISKYITYNEAVRSQTATRHKIDNTPNEEQLSNMKIVARLCFDPIREFYGKPLRVSSFFRCKALNTKIKGSRTSQHMEGKAIDIDTGDRNENRRIFMWASQNLKFTQLINEYDFSWVHISYDQNNLKQEILAIK